MEEIVDELLSQIEKIKSLEEDINNKTDIDLWKTKTIRILEKIPWNYESYVRDFSSIKFSSENAVLFGSWSLLFDINRRDKLNLEKAWKLLTDIIDELSTKGPIKSHDKWSNVTVNLNQSLSISINNILDRKLTWEQREEIEEILRTKDKKEKESKLIDFLKDLWVEVLAKLLKDIILNN